MRYTNLANFKSINKYVNAKINAIDSIYSLGNFSFKELYEFMFSEKENIFWETNDGIRIIKSTYGECYSQINLISREIKNIVQEPNESAVGIYMDNSLNWLLIFWAILKAGFNPVLLNLKHSPSITESVLKKMNVKTVFIDKTVRFNNSANLKTFFAEDVIKNANANYTDDSLQSVSCGNTFLSLTENFESAKNTKLFGKEIYFLSSGTTDNVKICAYGAEEFYFQIKNSSKMISQCKQIKKHYNGNLKLLTFLPFYHIFGFSAVYMWFAFFSRTFVELKNLNSDTILNTIQRHEVTHIFAVPIFWETIYKKTLSAISKKGSDLKDRFLKGIKIADRIGDVPVLGNLFIKKAFASVRENLFGESIRFLITGGSPINKDVLKFFNSIGYHFANGYGMTEIGITSVELSSKKKILNSASIGNPVDSIQYKVDENGNLLVKGKGVAKYIILGNTKSTYKEEWFNTNDLCTFKNHRFYINGRKDELIISSTGENINPNLIENEIASIDGVKEVCLINDTLPVLLVSLNKYISREKLNQIDLKIKSALQKLNFKNQINKIFYTEKNLIREDEIKINRKRILEEYKNKTLLEINPLQKNEQSTNSVLEETVKKFFASALETSPEKINSNADFFADLGGTSLDYFSAISQIQDEFEVDFPSNDLESFNTVSDIADFIEEKL